MPDIARGKLDMETSLQSVPEFELEPDEYGAKAYHMGYEAAREGRTSPGYLMSEGLHMWWSMGFADRLSGRPEKHVERVSRD